jgi:Abnormal spindle-like microcephaly-assoc'd, ASPM-SPD-2-Hydin
VFSLYFACARRPVRILGSLCTRLSVIFACYLGAVALSGGYVANGLATDPLRVLPGASTFGVVPFGQAVASEVSLRDESFDSINTPQLNDAEHSFVNSRNTLARSIDAVSNHRSDTGSSIGNADSYSDQFIAMNGSDDPRAQFHHRRGLSLSALSCSSASFAGSGSDTCTVTLTAAAGSGGFSVSLTSSSAAVTVPATLVIPANATSAGFTASVSSVSSAQTVMLTARAYGGSESFVLQLNAAAATLPTLPTLSISPTSVAFGNVVLNTPTTLPVALTSTGTAPVTVNSATLSGTGFTISGATFPVTLNPNLAVTLVVQFDPTAAGAATGLLTIQSNSSTNSNVAISLSGTGETAQHQVSLSWSAPSSSVVPIVGYNIYRSTGSSAAYQLLNSSIDAQTAYVDTTVQAGSTYNYTVESVDSSGTTSIPSNEATAAVP